MAPVRGKIQTAVGSLPWIKSERDQIKAFHDQENEDFMFYVRNDLEWLNEHMNEIFSSSQVNVVEIFKTPGKLRGKTPRTTKKRNVLETRAPLTDIFSSNVRFNQSPARSNTIYNATSQQQQQQAPSEQRLAEKNDRPVQNNHDSGYHGMTEDESSADISPVESQKPADFEIHADDDVMDVDNEPAASIDPAQNSQEQNPAEQSFHSAPEDVPQRQLSPERLGPLPAVIEDSVRPNIPGAFPRATPALEDPPKQTGLKLGELPTPAEEGSMLMDEDKIENYASPSDGSSPVRPLVRKSSLTFAALPAREPLTKKSVGGTSRPSQLDQHKIGTLNRESYFGRHTGGKSLGTNWQVFASDGNEYPDDDDDEGRLKLNREESDGESTIKLHSKASTQRLHDRINQLGMTQPARPTKSVPSALVASNQLSYPSLAQKEQTQASKPASSSKETPGEDDEDDWIKPSTKHNNQPSQAAKEPQHAVLVTSTEQESISPSPRKLVPPKAAATNDVNSPARQGNLQAPNIGKALSTSEATQAPESSTTPIGSPTKESHADGPLHASKSRLQSIMKSARGLFNSSAGVSAQAKMEAMSPLPSQQTHDPVKMDVDPAPTADLARDAVTVLYPSLSEKQFPVTPANPAPQRRTRSSVEREKKRKLQGAEEQQRDFYMAHNEPEKIIEQLPTTTPFAEPPSTAQPLRKSPRRMHNIDESKAQEQHARSTGPSASRPQAASSIRRPGEIKRPIKPSREVTQKPTLKPVAIKVGTLSQRIPLTNSALSSGLQDSLAPAQSKSHVITKKASNASISTASTSNTFKSASSTVSKPKALIAAERKKEQDEREAQRKAEHKREVERKRAIQQEEGRRKEEQTRRDAEAQREKERAEEMKRQAQKAAFEKRKQEEARKREQQQKAQQKTVADTTHPVQSEKSFAPSASYRGGELGGNRPPSRMAAGPSQNALKSGIKRVFEPDLDDSPVLKVIKPVSGPSYQQHDGKRRKTDDEDIFDMPVRPTMQPPIRQSNIRKDAFKPSTFSGNYPIAPPPAQNHANMKAPMSSAFPPNPFASQPSRPGHPMDMAKFTNGKIPFAEVHNPAAPSNNMQNPYKTPKLAMANKTAAASGMTMSPPIPNGDHIPLEEINTDSESDSESAQHRKRNQPSWVATPNLFEALREQEGQNRADSIFGPVAPLNMEEIFKDKSKHHRFRSRTSSANWFGTDRLTEAEIVTDNAAREKLRKEGGWTFGLAG